MVCVSVCLLVAIGEPFTAAEVTEMQRWMQTCGCIRRVQIPTEEEALTYQVSMDRTLQWSGDLHVHLQCERTYIRISPWMVVFIAMATAYAALGTGCTLLQCLDYLSLASLWGC